MKTFTLDEARTLLPVLRSLLQQAMEAKEQASARELKLHLLRQQIFMLGGMLVNVVDAAHVRAERDHAVQQARDAVAEIDAIGVQVKDLDSGLLDFPCALGEDTVLLCWRMGEDDIQFWHTMDSGFAGRQPLDERFLRGKSKPH